MKKKIFFIGILIVVAVVVVLIIKYISDIKKNQNNVAFHSIVNNTEIANSNTIAKGAPKNVQKELDSTTEKKETNTSKVDIVVGDKYFVTQLNEIYADFDSYEGKTIEIEGFPMTANGYTFVGRYGPGCCTNDQYAYFEYEYDKSLDLIDEKDWIKVIGKLKMGQDGESSYFYIEATSVEKMFVRGKDTVID